LKQIGLGSDEFLLRGVSLSKGAVEVAIREVEENGALVYVSDEL
jgi:hypothetical protein